MSTAVFTIFFTILLHSNVQAYFLQRLNGHSQLYKLLLYLTGSSITQCFSFLWTFLTDLYLQLVFLDHGIFLHSFHFLYFSLLWQARTIERELLAQLVKVSAQACVEEHHRFEPWSTLGLLSAPFSLPCSIWFWSLNLSISHPHRPLAHGHRQDKKRLAIFLKKTKLPRSNWN